MTIARVHYIDVAKGLAILLVVLGHSLAYSIGDNSIWFYAIYAFHMPFWFFLSGLLYHPCEWETFLSRKVKSLLYPYLLFSICNICTYYIFFAIGNPVLSVNVRFGGLWFVLTLFYVTVLYYLLDNFVLKNRKSNKSKDLWLLGISLSALFLGVEVGGTWGG